MNIDPAAVPAQDGELRRNTNESVQTFRTGTSRRESGISAPGLVRRMTTGLFTPARKIGKAPTYGQSILAAVKSSWL